MAYAVAQAAAGQRFNTRFACIAVMMSSDNKHNSALAKAISKFRPHCPVICMVPSHKEGRLLQIYSGLHPVLMVKGEREPAQALLHMKKIGMVSSSDQVLLVRQRSANLDIQIELCTA
jgi:pyruvate kinase